MSSSAKSYLIFGHILGNEDEMPWRFDQVTTDAWGDRYVDQDRLPWLKVDEDGEANDFPGDANRKLKEVWGDQDEYADKVHVDVYGYLDGCAFYALRCVEFKAYCSEPQRIKIHELADPTILEVQESRINAAMSILGLTFADGRRPGWQLVAEYG